MDAIERTVSLPVPPAEVWRKSFGSSEALASWFPEQVEGDFGPGRTFHLVWGKHRSQARIIEWDPERALAFQWHPGDAFELDSHPEAELTTVRFELELDGDVTRVRLVESGFSRIAAERRGWALAQNSEGWDEELGKLPATY